MLKSQDLLDGLNDLYRHSAKAGSHGFFGRVFDGLGLEIDDRSLEAAPGGGALLVMASGPVDASPKSCAWSENGDRTVCP